MRQSKCESCGLTAPYAGRFVVNGSIYCPACADKLVVQLKSTKAPMSVQHAFDPTICSQCGADNGNSEFARAGNQPMCAGCTVKIYNRPYPAWLKYSLVATLALLAFALIHGIPYFKAGRSLVKGERYLGKGDYKSAAASLEPVLEMAPDSEKVILLTAKAEILSGQAMKAQKIFDRKSTFEDGELTTEVLGLWDKTVKAYQKVDEANKLAEQKKWDEAASTMHQASDLYPEFSEIRDAAENLDIGAEFEKKNYDKFLSMSDAYYKRNAVSSEAAGMLASALACKYAVTNDPNYKVQAESMLEKARSLAQSSPSEMKAYEEYAERIRYRLTSRQIIDTDEYNRRFRPTKTDKKG